MNKVSDLASVNPKLNRWVGKQLYQALGDLLSLQTWSGRAALAKPVGCEQ
jgi:hypothetical protein